MIFRRSKYLYKCCRERPQNMDIIKKVVANRVNLAAQVEPDFPAFCPPSPKGRFPIKERIARLPERNARQPLRPHYNPRNAVNSLGDFLGSTLCLQPLLQIRFQKAVTPLQHGRAKNAVFLYPSKSTQGRLRCTQQPITAPHSRFIHIQQPKRGHRNMSPRRLGQRPHAIADRPSTLTPSTNPGLGVRSLHKKLHRYAL